MNYVNEGRKDYDALVMTEQVFLSFPNRTSPLKLNWWWFLGAVGNPTESVHPVLVPGAGVASHETRFAPTLANCANSSNCPEKDAYVNYMPWIDFLALAKDVKALPDLEISFVATVRERGYRDITKSCHVAFNDHARQLMATEYNKLKAAVAKGVKLDNVEDKQEYFSLPCIIRN
jgi:hypothetical protein